MLLVLAGLGCWQIQRLHWKEGLTATIEDRVHRRPVDIGGQSLREGFDYYPVSAFGYFQNDRTFYLISISLTGQGGYHVLTPLALNDGRFILVDRGWIPYEFKQSANFFQPAGLVLVTGLLRMPEHFALQSKNNPEHNDWYWPDLQAMAQVARVPEFQPYLLEADDTPNEGGYPVGGQTRLILPNNHLSYAVTWFGMIPVLLIIYCLSSFRKNAAN